jgi:AAA family ATP:ADP antiporter
MKIFELLKSDDPRYKGHLWFFLSSYFFVLFNYPLVRSSATSLFFEEFGAKSAPVAWLIAVFVLSLSIFIFNRFQRRHSVQKVFLLASVTSSLLFGLSTLGHFLQYRYFSAIAFIWKEIYIVLQIHLLLAYANNYFKQEDFKFMVGPVGAVGSIGGVCGGLLTTFISENWGTDYVAWCSLIFVFLPACLFIFTPNLERKADAPNKISPLESLKEKDIKNYVFHIALLVILSQFIINIIDFKFNLSFESSIPVSSDRTAFLGSVYTWTHLLTFILQFVCLPMLLPRISEKSLHLYIPISYLVCSLGLFLVSGNFLLPIAAFYIYIKAADYSLFSGGKELLYQPLKAEQKYGAKYLTDMLVYRVSKALIAVVLIYLQSSYILNIMTISFLLIWLVIVFKIFGIHRRLFN